MGILLRLVGAFWALFSLRPVLETVRAAVASGFRISPSLPLVENLLLFAGGLGLIFLREWGRWLLVIALAVGLVDKVGPWIVQARFSTSLLRPVLLYGIFLVLLLMPPARAVTRK